jgi:hypothetical protein
MANLCCRATVPTIGIETFDPEACPNNRGGGFVDNLIRPRRPTGVGLSFATIEDRRADR